MRVFKDGKSINCTERAYEVIYKDQGYINLNELTVAQLKEKAEQKGLEYDSKIKKDDLIKLLEGAK